ncbi:hypothetical protein K1M76_06095 [Brucella abortus]|nr:hypothetical protein DO78_1170 [Brucella abortus]AIJ61644.1 hypothetical protein DK53_1249 [Brucella abortus bv. 9 str. C68]AIJ63540.1 hypothetical protein DO74_625 [Brucella abortus bv. 6 str. 870]ENP31594.1 hypothetical protein C084_01104 [Brucella abortus 64/122]ENR46182.1 hypothetical protein B993_00948 [Brucella abortus 355/78]ENR58031.1 hypothetical protein B994_00949 [Brucella abortus 63/138]ENR60564.1 hypothetical protein B992_01535 [Brucella abortus 63/144]ENS02042.1 hypothetical
MVAAAKAALTGCAFRRTERLARAERLRPGMARASRCRLAAIGKHAHHEHGDQGNDGHLQDQAEHAGKTAETIAKQHADQAADQQAAKHGAAKIAEQATGTLCRILCASRSGTGRLRRACVRCHRAFDGSRIVGRGTGRRRRRIGAHATATKTATARAASLSEIDSREYGNKAEDKCKRQFG